MARLDAAERVMTWAAGETPFTDVDLTTPKSRPSPQIPAVMSRMARVSGIFDDWTPSSPDKTTQLTQPHEQAQGEQ